MQNTTNASNNREFLGITQNECTLQGKVIGDPVIHGDSYAYLTLRTSVREQDGNGQWVDVSIDVPVITMDTNKVTSISNYVKDGKLMLFHTYYKSWMNEGVAQHAFFIKNMQFGPNKPTNTGSGAPDLPVS